MSNLQPTIRARLLFVAALSAVLALIPAAQLAWQWTAERAFVRSELSALPANRGWQAVIAAVQKHREAAARAGAGTEGAAGLAPAAAAVREHLAALPPRLTEAAVGQARQESVAVFARRFEALAAAASNGGDAGQLLEGHRRLVSDMMAEVAELNADAQLLLDPEPAGYFAIIAGLQLAPRVSDALSELAAIGLAVRVDDTALLASARARYEESSAAMRLHLAQAGRLDPAMQAQFADALGRLEQQSTAVGQLLGSVAADVDYPLARFVSTLTSAQSLQASISQDVIERIDAALQARIERQNRQAVLVTAVLAVGLLAVGLLLWRTLRSVLGSVERAVQVTERIAGGDLSRPVPRGGLDEMGRVLLGLGAMQDRLRDLLQQMQQAAGGIHTGSAEVARGSRDLSERSEQTAARLQEAAATVQRIDSTLQASAQVASEADRLAAQAARTAHDGGDVVAEVVGAMSDIHERSRRIAEITGVIDGLAFQTNILALNAAVEAARAGDQGRGFAVVAAEVRQLAQRSAQAAREIKSLIVSATERVEAGSARAGHAGEAMRAVVGSIEQASMTMRRLSSEVAAHVHDMAAVNAAVAGVDHLTQQNAALVEQSAAAAASMDHEAQRMSQLAGSFRL